MRVYALINCWPMVGGDADTPPIDDREASDTWLEALDGVYNYDGLLVALGQPLSAHQHAILKKDGELTLDEGLREIRCFDIDPGSVVKGWVAKARKQGAADERDRIFSLLCYFTGQLADAHGLIKGLSDLPLWMATLREFGEMITDGTVAPVRYYLKGRKRGRIIEGSGAAVAPTTEADTVPVCRKCGFTLDQIGQQANYWECSTTACTRRGERVVWPPDPCNECGSPLDTGGFCHFVDCAKAVEPKVDLDGKLAAGRIPAQPKVDLCASCQKPLQSFNQQEICLTGGCRYAGVRVVADPTRPCAACQAAMVPTGNDFFKCIADTCSLFGIQVRHTRGLLPVAAVELCGATFMTASCVLTKGHTGPHASGHDKKFTWAQSLNRHPQATEADCCALPPPELRAVNIHEAVDAAVVELAQTDPAALKVEKP